KVKDSKIDKTYRAVVKCEKPVSRKDLSRLKHLISEIRQKTPHRVLHRRADLLRKRKIRLLRAKYIDKNTFILTVRSESGLYIKELISGDEGRTSPSVSEILANECRCKELDVVRIHK
ncbi:MAG: tRNA pseudouridine(54/55) synthase Pus10, partial [Candidatus Aenigmarchaeota archaeon]|nr:tRNA pseudouridine(54/55) synthase Pus10 [Candidatus Aenigmarchaeota archaeon]MDI6722911.1 tRNA pseudouridine(54/55) synthase Pus10 [Candidatus Aenigmarchaeota archaeon]